MMIPARRAPPWRDVFVVAAALAALTAWLWVPALVHLFNGGACCAPR